MTAAEILGKLKAEGIEIMLADGSLLCRPRAAVSTELQLEIAARKADLVAILAPDPTRCPICDRLDYLPLGAGWRRCWVCGRRWGAIGADPGDPPDLIQLTVMLGPSRKRCDPR